MTRVQFGGGDSSAPLPSSVSRPGNAEALSVTSPVVDPRDQDASILLLGIRGTGKTSLAILAATCIKFRLVDADQHFHHATSMSRAAFLARYGLEECRRHELDLMRSLLSQNPTGCIIVCGLGSADGTVKQLLVELGRNHPLIHVMRDAEDVARYLRTPNVANIERLSGLAGSIYRAACNYEFYNLSEPLEKNCQVTSLGAQLPNHPSLTLKNVEQDFLRLIHSVRCQSSRPRLLQARNIISFIPPESRHFTYALTIPMQSIQEIALRLRSTDLVVDAVEIVIELDQLLSDDQIFGDAVATRMTKAYYNLRRNVRLPVIIHVVVPESYWRPSSSPAVDATQMWSDYLLVVKHALRLAPEYLTVDLRCDPGAARSLIALKASTKVIGHLYDPVPDVGAWDFPARMQLLVTAADWGCDLTRLCQYSEFRADNLAVQNFLRRASLLKPHGHRLIAYNVGSAGRQSCFTNSVFSPVTHQLVEDAMKGMASCHLRPLLTVQCAQNALYSSFTLDGLVFGIFGSAVNSSMSPPMHNAAFAFYKMPHTYGIYQSSSIQDLGPIVQNPNFGGASISAPFKEEVFSVLHHVSPEAQAIGAVNTVIPLRSRHLETVVDRNKAGPVVALFGDNTDWMGLHTCVRRNLSPVNAAKSNKTALMLGAGGMAQAAIYALIRLGVETIFVHNRTFHRAQKLAERFNGKNIPVPDFHTLHYGSKASLLQSGTSSLTRERTRPVQVQAIASMRDHRPADFEPPTIIISCTTRVSRNGEPKADNTLPESWLESSTGGVAVELAYDPLDTPFLQQVRALNRRGWIAVHGLEFLPEQAYAQFELFTGRPAPKHLMEAQILEHLGVHQQT